MNCKFENKTFIVMSKSRKYHGYCVAGFDVENQEWCRLISSNKNSDFAIDPNDFVDQNGNEIAILSEITVSCAKVEGDPIQTENYLLDSSAVIINHGTDKSKEKLGKSLKIFRNPEAFIYCDRYAYLTEEEIGKYNYSLVFVKVYDFSVYCGFYNKCKCSFYYNGRHYSNISYTCHGGPKENVIFPEAFILVSIPHKPYDGKYYKFVSSCFVTENGQ